TLLFFFTEKKKRSKKRKEFAFHLYYKVKYHTKIIQRIFHLCKIFYIYVETPPPPNGGPPPLSGEAFLTFEFPPTKLPRRGEQAATAAVTLSFLQLKLGRKVSGGLLSLSKSAVAISAGRRADSPPQRENIALKIAYKKTTPHKV
ncbi:hypothetical protein, partial [uncultured Ruminococcus sp.]|uniref:hypothetical protein n=1 Tax=uncultured Ruminococcus sp. TaxID=165186 RepID=UPI0026652262